MIQFPLVSIIIPAFNAQKYLSGSVNSVLSQTYSNWELIIVDDGSTDDTARLGLEFMQSDSRIKYIYQTNGKQGKARNKGIQSASGEFLAFLDADDWWIKEKLALQVPILLNNPGLALIFSKGFLFDEGKIQDYDVIIKDRWGYSEIPLFIESNRIPILSVLMRREALLKVGSFAEEMNLQNAEDYELWLKLLYAGFEFRSIDEKLFFYRIHKNQSTFGRGNLNKALFTLYCNLYWKDPIHEFSRELVVRIASFLNYATFRNEAVLLIKNWIELKHNKKKAFFFLLNILPAKWQNEYLRSLIASTNG